MELIQNHIHFDIHIYYGKLYNYETISFGGREGIAI